MTSSTCCGVTPRDITIALTDSTLAFVYCERCETRRWFRDGSPVTIGDIKATASAALNKKTRRAALLSA